MLRFGDCRGVQLLQVGGLVFSLLTMQIWATRRRGGGADRAVQRGTVCYLLGNTWRVRDYLDYQAHVFRTLDIFHGLVPRSCSTLPLLPSRFFRGTSLRVHLGYLFASGSALHLILHPPMW